MATSRKSLAALQQHEAALHTALAKKKAALAQQRAQVRAAEQKALTKRRFLMGKMVLALPALARLSLEDLQDALRWLAWCVEDEGRWQIWRRAGREASAPDFGPCSLTSISARYETNSQNETQE